MVKGQAFVRPVREDSIRLLERVSLKQLSYRQAATKLKRTFRKNGGSPAPSTLHNWQNNSKEPKKRGRPVAEHWATKIQEQRIERFLRAHAGQAPLIDIVTKVEWHSELPNSLRSRYRLVNQMSTTKQTKPIDAYEFDETDKAERLRFAKKYKGVDQTGWHFEDESGFSLYGKKAQIVLALCSRGRIKRFIQMHNHYDVMAWGCFCCDSTNKLHLIECKTDGTINAALHHKLLINHLEFDETVLVDNARPHSTRKEADFLDTLKITVFKNCVRSPELNPIELVWSRVKKIVYKGNTCYKNIQSLKAAIHNAWNIVMADKNYLQSIVIGLQKRYTSVIAKRGDHIV